MHWTGYCAVKTRIVWIVDLLDWEDDSGSLVPICPKQDVSGFLAHVDSGVALMCVSSKDRATRLPLSVRFASHRHAASMHVNACRC
jgi:hypothetical protein